MIIDEIIGIFVARSNNKKINKFLEEHGKLTSVNVRVEYFSEWDYSTHKYENAFSGEKLAIKHVGNEAFEITKNNKAETYEHVNEVSLTFKDGFTTMLRG